MTARLRSSFPSLLACREQKIGIFACAVLVFCAALVCLTTCGHGSGNGTPCAGRAICASFAPLAVYIYGFGGESCVTRLTLLRSVPLRPEPWPRLAPSGVRRGARGLGLSHAPCAAAPAVFAAIRAAMLRRRDTVSSPCDVSHRASDEPHRRMSLSSALAPSSLASPSIRRVSFRSFCARRRSVSSLNLAATHPPRFRPRHNLISPHLIF